MTGMLGGLLNGTCPRVVCDCPGIKNISATLTVGAAVEEQQQKLLREVRDSMVEGMDSQRRVSFIGLALEAMHGLQSTELSALSLLYAERYCKGLGYVSMVCVSLLFSRTITLVYLTVAFGEGVGRSLSATKQKVCRSRLAAWCRRCCCPGESAVQPAAELIDVVVSSPGTEEKRALFLTEKARLSEVLRETQEELDGLAAKYEEDVGAAWLVAGGHKSVPGPETVTDLSVTRAVSFFGFLSNPIGAWFAQT